MVGGYRKIYQVVTVIAHIVPWSSWQERWHKKEKYAKSRCLVWGLGVPWGRLRLVPVA